MVSCAILNCSSTSKKVGTVNRGISFHIFPNDPDIKNKWIEATGRKIWFPIKSSRICSVHFHEDNFTGPSKYRRLISTAYPTIDVLMITNDEKATPSPLPQKIVGVDRQLPSTSSAVEHRDDSDSDASGAAEKEIGVLTELQTGVQDPLANAKPKQCRLCAKNTKNCIDVIGKPYIEDNKTRLILNDVNIDIEFNKHSNVCVECDRKLLDMFNFVKLVKNAQETLLNASIEEATETLIVKMECESPTPDDDEIEDTKEGIVDSLTTDETELVEHKVFTHKKRKSDKDTKQRTPKRVKVENDEVTSEISELVMDIKEEAIEMDEDAKSDIHKNVQSADRDTGPASTPSEVDIATNALLNEMAGDGFS